MTDNRQKLTDIAQLSVQKDGFRNLSFRSLANAVGIKSSSVHYHFPGKSDLAQALIEQYTDTFMSKLDEIAASPWPLKRKANAFMDIIEEVAQSDRLCLCGMFAAELESLTSDNRRALRVFFDAMTDWLTDQFSANEASIRSALPCDNLARVIVSGVEGALLVDRVQGNTENLSAQRQFLNSLLD